VALQRISSGSRHPVYGPIKTRKATFLPPKSKDKTPRIFLIKPDNRLKENAQQIFDLMKLSFPNFSENEETNMKVDSIEYAITEEEIFVFAMKIGSKIIGFIISEPHDWAQEKFIEYEDDLRMPRKKNSYYTTLLAIHPDYRRKSYAKKLRCRLIKQLKHMEIDYLTCHIRVNRGSFDTTVKKSVKNVKISYKLEDYQDFGEPFNYVEMKL
jgi:hypothetical protein